MIFVSRRRNTLKNEIRFRIAKLIKSNILIGYISGKIERIPLIDSTTGNVTYDLVGEIIFLSKEPLPEGKESLLKSRAEELEIESEYNPILWVDGIRIFDDEDNIINIKDLEEESSYFIRYRAAGPAESLMR